MEKITTGTCEIFMDELGILHLKMLKGPEMDLGDAIDNFIVAKNLTGQKPALRLLDMRAGRKISGEARKFIKKGNASESCIAKAVVVSSPLIKFAGDLLNGIVRKKFPVKTFTCEKEARQWLKTFL